MNEIELFAAAVAVSDQADRASLLDRECAGDAPKRARLEALLSARDRPDSLLDRPAVAPPDPDTATTRTIGHEGGLTAGDEVPLGFLATPRRADSRGRIGHYEVLQVLGQGGFGIVFRAFDEVLHRVVAVKVLAPQLAATSPARKRFLREARSSAQVRHENVVQVYEVGEAPLPYIAMEFIPGETLQQRLDRIGPVEASEVVRIGRQIAEGLAAAHATDLIHRDIKPGNVLLEGGAGRVKITDFGLARAADDASISQSGIIAGTPMYMAPEQALGHKLDQRADLFSLGSVLYQMAAGRPPFRSNGTVAVLKRVAEDAPRDIREITPETPQWLCDIIAKLHAKDPDQRFQSAREVADVLADCEAQLKANSKLKDYSRIPRGKPQSSGRRTRRWKWAAAAGALLLLVFGTVWFSPMGNRFLRNRGALEFVPQPGLAEVFVLDNNNDDVVHDWMDMRTPHTVHLPSGKKYGLFARCQPGWEVSEWVMEKHWLFGDFTMHLDSPGVQTDVGQGERVTIRVVCRQVPPPQPPTAVDGWVQLFDRKDLIGWKTHPDQPGDWRIDSQGILVGSGATSHLFTERGDFANFHLRAEVKINDGGGGGIYVRVPAIELPRGGFYPIGLKATAGTGADIPIGSICRALSPNAEVEAEYVLSRRPPPRPGEWFTLEVLANQGSITVKINGATTAEFSGLGPEFLHGHVALQAHQAGSVIEFRKIEIKELPANSPESSTPPLAVAPFDAAKAKEHQDAWAKHLGVPVEIENAIGMKLRLVPPGRFQMGSSEDFIEQLVPRAQALHEKDLRSETPQRPVEISAPFYMGQFEVTVGQFRKFVEATGHKTTAETNGKGGSTLVDGKQVFRPELIWRHSDVALSDDHPVVEIDLRDANEFCAWLSKKDGRTYVVPDEKHWEFACRAGSTSPWYGRQDALDDFAWNFSNADDKTHPVGGKQPNAFGLHDMLGNVDELCPADDGGTVGRGGMAHHNIICVRCAARRRFTEDIYFRRGFRVAIVGDLKAKAPATEPSPAITPFTDANVHRIAALPAAEQVEEVRKELMRRNRGFDGNFDHKISEDGVVTEFKIVTDQVSDISPIRVFNSLLVLECRGQFTNKSGGLLADLTPLKGMNLAGLTHLDLSNTKVTDAGLADLASLDRLTNLNLANTKVTAAGVEKLAKALPKCKIIWDGGVIGPK